MAVSLRFLLSAGVVASLMLAAPAYAQHGGDGAAVPFLLNLILLLVLALLEHFPARR